MVTEGICCSQGILKEKKITNDQNIIVILSNQWKRNILKKFIHDTTQDPWEWGQG